MRKPLAIVLAAIWFGLATNASAQIPNLSGVVRDDSGAALPGVSVELGDAGTAPLSTVTDTDGRYRFDGVRPGRYQVTFLLINFSRMRRDLELTNDSHLDAVLHLALNADVTVTGRRTFANLADAEHPAENLVGIAQSASQGAITAKQLDERPIMRQAEVLEAVPGVIVTQHSGEGKANQLFLRGFNLDHGTDFATSVAGIPVNLPTHAHGQGYSDLNFLIPELVAGVTFSKGPYYADQGDFATAGSSTISYADTLDAPIARFALGGDRFGRVLFAASPAVGAGHLLTAVEAERNDGPWAHPDDFRKLNGVLRYSQGDRLNGFSISAMGYRGRWNATDQVPVRAIDDGSIGRFGAVDASDGGDTYRYSVSAGWRHATSNTSTRVDVFGLGYGLDLFSNFTYYLDDPAHGDQIEQTDRRLVTGTAVAHRRVSRWRGRPVQNTFGLQVRNDDIADVDLYHTQARVRLATRSRDRVLETSGGAYAQNEIEWTPWLRTMTGLRADASRFGVVALDAANSGASAAGVVSPKGGATLGPWKGTEFYLNAGTGFHSNDARGTTITRNADGGAADRVTPLVRAKGAEAGIRTVAIPHLQSTVSVWMLRLDSELVFSGDEGTTQPSRPSARRGVEWTNYYRPLNWMVFDADLSWSRSRFTKVDPAGPYVPEALGTVVSAGAAIDGYRRASGSIRWRYFGPRTLIADNSIRSKATGLVNLQGGYQIAKGLRVALDAFNLLNTSASDIDYFYRSRLPGEPSGGVDDFHTHPAVPRSARINLVLGF